MQTRFEINIDRFQKIPGFPLAYWISERSIEAFNADQIATRYISGGRNKTHNNEKYVRTWWEIYFTTKWKPYANGGDFRRWYGNNTDVVDWSCAARSFYGSHGGLLNEKFWNINGITWTDISGTHTGYRMKLADQVFSSCSPTIICVGMDAIDYNLLGFLNSKVSDWVNAITNSTLHTLVGNVLSYPDKTKNAHAEGYVKENIDICRQDWDCFETSWDFKAHPLI